MEKDPSAWAAVVSLVVAAWDVIPEPVRAAITAAVMALLRVMYDEQEPQWLKSLLDAALCGVITLGVGHLISAFGLPQNLAVFVGAVVGFYGVEQIRAWGRQFIAAWLEKWK